MCDFDTGYTTLVGPEGELRILLERWAEVAGDRRSRGPGPDLLTLGDQGLGTEFWDSRCPAVAVLWHHGHAERTIAHTIQARLLATMGPTNILCEPGFRLELASSGSANANPRVMLDHSRVKQARAALELGSGRTVAILDTGNSGATEDMVDFIGGLPVIRASEDPHGHGTAVIGLVRALRPDASVAVGRVANENGRVESKDLFIALIWALWAGRHDVVNVSLSNQLAGDCSTMLGGTLPHVLELCRRDGAGSRATLVAAAGNSTQGQRIGYPALLPDVDVAYALDWKGANADYNVDVSDFGGRVVKAFGGTATEPFGMVGDGHASMPIFGTSFAAAVVTASHLA